MNYLNSYFKALKYVISLIKFKEEKIKNIQFSDEYYTGLNGEKTELRVFYPKRKKSQSIIIFPGASPYAENHPGMIMLGNGLRDAGYNVFLPRIPNLKALKLEKENVDWFAHCYTELLKHNSIIKNDIMVIGLSYGGATLLKASLDVRMQKNKPKSYLSYGTYFSINTALNFFLTGEITYKNKKYKIPPHEWGMIVLFYNFIDTIDTKYDTKTIKKLLQYRIQDQNNQVNKILGNLDKLNKDLVQLILNGKINNDIERLVRKIIDKNKILLEYLSPELWVHNVKDKVFVIHGANDSMVPFTESILLDNMLPDSQLLISFVYEHREISTNRGIFFKIKELSKMISFFAVYFRFNK